MLELLAAIQSADPPSLVLWGLFVFAAGMYPVGFMLGASCSACCSAPPCSQCTTGELPDTVTVTFDGFTDQTAGPDLISLSFSSCFGGGASARVTAPGGDPDTDKGPISAVSLTSAGSGYAKLGRVAPTLTISGGSGTGATFTPTLASTDDACGIPTWSLSSVAFKGGTGYADGEELSVSEAVGDTAVAVAVVRVQTTRTQPTLSASASGGSGATFTVTTASNGDTPQTWGVSGVSVSGTTLSYADMTKLSFSVTGVVEQLEADAYIRTVRVQPTPTLTVQSSGTGAGLTATLTQIDDPGEWPARPAWEVSAITITAGGTGYSVYDMIECTTDGQGSPFSWFYAYVEEVDEDGAILAVTISSGGAFFKSTGEIDEVQVLSGGAYYHDDGIPTGVTVENGGQYYREDETAQPYVATVTVSVSSQVAPSNGSGAVMTATVDSSVGSATFGQLTGVTITSGGSGYLAWEWRNTKCCGDYYNGLTVVLKRSGCVYEHRFCGVGNRNGLTGLARLSYSGPNSLPGLVLFSESGNASSNIINSAICNTAFTANKNVTDCSDWSGVTFAATGGATATVSVGGEYDPAFRNPGGYSCHICCKGEELMPSEISVELTDNNPGSSVFAGTYVMNILPPFGASGVRWGGGFGTITGSEGTGISILVLPVLCSGQTSSEFTPNDIGALFTEDCNSCHKKCLYVAQVLTTLSVGYFSLSSATCADCESTPTCSPSGKSFSLKNPSSATARFGLSVE